MMLPKSSKLLSLLSFLLFLTGCWDSRDIEEMAMEVGAAFDKVEENEIAEEDGQHKNIIKLTLQTVDTSQSPSQKKKQDEATQQQKYKNLTGTGDSILETIRDFSLEQDRPPFGQHIKVTVVSEELAKEMSLNIILSLFMRTHEIRDSCILLISQGRGEETLKTKDGIPAFHLIGVQRNQYKTVKVLPETTLGKASSKMADHSSFIIQGVVAKNGKIRFNSGAIIKGRTKKVVGFLNEEEIIGLNWLTGEAKGGIVKGRDEETNQPILYEISSLKSKITPHVNGKRIWFDVNIESVGRLNEDWVLQGDAFDNKFIKRAEIAATKEVKHLINQTLNKMQKKYQIDVAGFGEQLRIHYPKVWQQVKQNWDQSFSKIPIHYKVKITIDDYMIEGKKVD